MSLEDCAKASAGNWQKFGSFAWFHELEDPENFYLWNLSSRDSGLLAESNRQAILKALDEADPEGEYHWEERHSHWAVGHLDVLVVRVYEKGKIVPLFKEVYELKSALEDYPVLDENDYSRREYEQTLKNIEEVAYRLELRDNLPEGWVAECFSWLWENNQSAVENNDDQGGYPSQEDLEECLKALGYLNDKLV